MTGWQHAACPGPCSCPWAWALCSTASGLLCSAAVLGWPDPRRTGRTRPVLGRKGRWGGGGEEGPGARLQKASCLSHQEAHPVGCLAAAASRYLLQLATPSSSPKTASKTTISFLLRDGGKHMRTHSPATSSLLSRTGCLRQRHRAGAGPGGRLRNPRCPLSPAQSRLPPLTGLLQAALRLRRPADVPASPANFPFPCTREKTLRVLPSPLLPRKTAHSRPWAVAGAPAAPLGWAVRLAAAQAWPRSRYRKQGKEAARWARLHLPHGPSRHLRE